MLENYFVKGLAIAIIFGVPAGVIGALTIQRTLEKGFFAGLITGLGSSVADILYSCIGIYGITIISNFLLVHQSLIRIVGSSFIFFYGIRIFQKKDNLNNNCDFEKKGKLFSCFFSSFLIAIMNPGTIMSFIVAFATFGIQDISSLEHGVTLICGILAGSIFWWITVSGIVSVLRNKISDQIYRSLNKVLGILMMIFAIIIIIVEILAKSC